jgi:hypothetical protein
MENTRYRIIFEGKIKEGESLSRVKARMVALFKRDISVIERIFKESPTVIQQGKEKEAAWKYKEALERTGALCRIEAETPPSTALLGIPGIPGGEESPLTPQTAPPRSPQKVQTGTGNTPVVESQKESKPPIQHIKSAAWKSLGGGLALTVFILFIPFLSYIFNYLLTLVHEFGHAIAGWLYGYPSIPAFDFVYGGGITSHQERKIIIVIVIYLLFASLVYLYRKKPFTLVFLLIIVVLYTVFAFTSGHQVIILFMGHGFELLFAIVFLYRALSGSSIIVPIERPLYAFLGFFIVFIDIRFAHRLMTSTAFQADYGAAKGGGHWMDFSRIAHEFLNVQLTSVAAFFFVLCVLTPIAAFLIFRYKAYLASFFKRLLDTELN